MNNEFIWRNLEYFRTLNCLIGAIQEAYFLDFFYEYRRKIAPKLTAVPKHLKLALDDNRQPHIHYQVRSNISIYNVLIFVF